MEYYKFLETGFLPTDLVDTTTGCIIVEAVVETDHGVGLSYFDEDGNGAFIEHGEVVGLASGRF